jgi:hypothetical protein
MSLGLAGNVVDPADEVLGSRERIGWPPQYT